jgi:hypothetical protein
MFFCDKCRKEKEWPKGLMRSVGPCEICGKTAECHDVHHSQCLSSREKAIQAIEDRLADFDFAGSPMDDRFCDAVHPLAFNYLEDEEIDELGTAGARAVIRAFLRWALENTDVEPEAYGLKDR